MRFQRGIALHIYDGELRVVHMRKGRSLCRSIEVASLRLSRDANEAAVMIRSFLTERGWFGLPATVGLDAEDVILRLLDIGEQSSSDVGYLIQESFEQISGMATGETVNSYARQRCRLGGRVLLTLTRQDIVEEVLRRVEGLQVVRAMPVNVAVFSAVQAVVPYEDRPVVCICPDRDGTDVLVGTKECLLYAQRFSIGGKHLDALLDGADGAPMGERDPWIAEILTSLGQYKDQHSSAEYMPSRLVLCGDGVTRPGVLDTVERAVGLSSQLLRDIYCEEGVEDIDGYAQVLGLALAECRGSEINLLSPERFHHYNLRRQAQYWLAAAGGITVSLMLGLYNYTQDNIRYKAVLADRRACLTELNEISSKLSRELAANDLLRRKMQPLRMRVKNSQVMLDVLQAVADAKHPDDWIILMADADTYSENEEVMGPPRGGSSSESGGRKRRRSTEVVIEGYSPEEDLSTVRAMIDQLRGRPEIADADLLADDLVMQDDERDELWADYEGYLFAVGIQLEDLP